MQILKELDNTLPYAKPKQALYKMIKCNSNLHNQHEKAYTNKFI